ncbi:Pyruvate kinase protein [Halorhabdus tiamatea SARL4B]|uniref:Pyruvate kinase n=1 Tax=Halorhabdus tiamatea SARL4B TaxID=1033806 RepID=F7PNS4_9EURY|nr:pyruvate kinase [Halorhabdus tiamatea]ERJ06767.1 Pyruvate kinase protein [Halorhabdus tiamatea SARL4B]CCQ33690.1 pyruvate kinase [Halorhabdus tiamatea SARL4B]
MRNAKIVCTLGPASETKEDIRALAEAGMSVARLNASHGSPEHRRTMIDRIREVDAEMDKSLAVMHDIPGPEVRTAPIREPIELEADTTVRFYKGDDATPEDVGLSVDISVVEPGDSVLLDDGRIETTVEKVEDGDVYAHVENGGELGARKGVNVPGVELGLPFPTEQDRTELEVAAEKEVDLVAASFVRDGDDVRKIEDFLAEEGTEVPVVSKVERKGAVDNLDSIIEASYGVMVARGDLGVELPLQEVPLYQKRIIRKCNEAGVPVITATEMLDSMEESRRPTRAESSDVANAIFDGTDAVMLSGETAIGEHPPRVVSTMADIVNEVEQSAEYAELRDQRIPSSDQTRTDALAHAARTLADDIDATAIVAASESGYTALRTAKFRPEVPIIASTPNERVRRQLALARGIFPTTAPFTTEGADAIVQNAVQSALKTGIAESGDTVVVISGMMTELEGTSTSNMLKVHLAAESVATGQSVVDGLVTGPLVRTTDGDLESVPEGAILAVPEDFDGEFLGDPETLGGIIDAHTDRRGHAVTVGRRLDIPTASHMTVPADIEDGATVTLDAERGVLYKGQLGTLDE